MLLRDAVGEAEVGAGDDRRSRARRAVAWATWRRSGHCTRWSSAQRGAQEVDERGCRRGVAAARRARPRGERRRAGPSTSPSAVERRGLARHPPRARRRSAASLGASPVGAADDRAPRTPRPRPRRGRARPGRSSRCGSVGSRAPRAARRGALCALARVCGRGPRRATRLAGLPVAGVRSGTTCSTCAA